MHIGNYINMMHQTGQDIANAFRLVGKEHSSEPDIQETCRLLASWTDELVQKFQPFTEKYAEQKSKEPERLMGALFNKPRKGSLGMLRDLQDLWLMTNEGEICCVILRQAASALHDKELVEMCNEIEKTAKRQSAWLLTRMKSAAPQTLIVAE